ncbi:hypothetical protein, partial [Halorubrum sp. SP3]
MSTQEPNYPKEYRGNQIHDETKVSNLQPSERPRLSLVTNPREIDHILESIGVEHDRESIVLEDSYNCLWVDTENGEYVEVWGIHKSTPYLDRYA